MEALAGRLITLPVLHGSLELAVATRQALEGVRPDCVAVELPETLEGPVLRAVERLPLLSVISYQDSQGQPVYLPVEPADPIVEALRYGREQGLPCALIDQDVEGYGRYPEALPDSYAIKRLGHARYWSACQEALERLAPDPQDAGREAVMAFHLRRLLARYGRVLFVCGMAHATRVERLLEQPAGGEPLRRIKREGLQLWQLSEQSSREVLAEPPFLQAAYEQARQGGAAALDGLDRLSELYQLVQRARRVHEKDQGESVALSALEVLFRFARNYALVEGKLCPDLYQLLVAARGAVDDNFAHAVWELASRYPYQPDRSELPTIDLSIEDLYGRPRYFRFHRTLKSRRQQLLHLVRPRPREERPGEWRESWTGQALCSYQPEDLVVESYGDFLKKKSQGLLSAERARVEPFSASLLDGIDLRETLRNWHEGRIYVREQQRVRGSVGAVVVIFDEDRGAAARYPWTTTWQGEHAQESDMAFYATPLGEQLVGPGISRCEYGGFLLSYPPGRMFHVFEDPFYEIAESKPERLLLAAIDYAKEPLVVYAGPRPPRSRYRSLVERFGKRLVYIPLADLSPLTLKSLRVFHVLDGKPVRDYAKDYIR